MKKMRLSNTKLFNLTSYELEELQDDISNTKKEYDNIIGMLMEKGKDGQ